MNQCEDCERPIRHEEKRYVLTEDRKDWRCLCPRCSAAQND